jgi:hypothetical protein
MTLLAYQMQRILHDIYKLGTAKQARQQLEEWCQWVKNKAAEKGHELLSQRCKRPE